MNRLLKKSKGGEKNPRNNWQWKHDNSKPMGGSKSSSKREDYSNKILPQETRKTSTGLLSGDLMCQNT